ncbi:MAG: response regulator [Gemmatimonadaceae bacterium]
MPVRADVIRVLIADDHAVVREGIRHVLMSDAGFDVVGEAVDGMHAVALARQLKPDVVILDLSMPELSGFEAAEQIRGTVPQARILVLSMYDHEEYVARSVRAGANGYLRKDSSPAELRDAVRAIAEGRTSFAAPGRHAFISTAPEPDPPLASSRLARLTAREREVLTEIAHGRSNKEIGARFNISVRTVESHRETLMRKLELRGAAALTRFAIDHGLVE